MQPFTTHSGLVAPLDQRDIDTDQIIPQRFLRKIARTGFGPDLFANVRYLGDDTTPNPDFVLNEQRYAGASILLARDNFGCGSSREHAPWALGEYGFRVIIAPSFADIFAANCVNNGLLTVSLEATEIDVLFREAKATTGYSLTVDLPRQVVITPEGQELAFIIDDFRKDSLLSGLDPIGRTLRMSDDIGSFERRQEACTVNRPWIGP